MGFNKRALLDSVNLEARKRGFSPITERWLTHLVTEQIIAGPVRRGQRSGRGTVSEWPEDAVETIIEISWLQTLGLTRHSQHRIYVLLKHLLQNPSTPIQPYSIGKIRNDLAKEFLHAAKDMQRLWNDIPSERLLSKDFQKYRLQYGTNPFDEFLISEEKAQFELMISLFEPTESGPRTAPLTTFQEALPHVQGLAYPENDGNAGILALNQLTLGRVEEALRYWAQSPVLVIIRLTLVSELNQDMVASFRHDVETDYSAILKAILELPVNFPVRMRWRWILHSVASAFIGATFWK